MVMAETTGKGMISGITTVTKRLPLMLNKKSPNGMLGAFSFMSRQTHPERSLRIIF